MAGESSHAKLCQGLGEEVWRTLGIPWQSSPQLDISFGAIQVEIRCHNDSGYCSIKTNIALTGDSCIRCDADTVPVKMNKGLVQMSKGKILTCTFFAWWLFCSMVSDPMEHFHIWNSNSRSEHTDLILNWFIFF